MHSFQLNCPILFNCPCYVTQNKPSIVHKLGTFPCAPPQLLTTCLKILTPISMFYPSNPPPSFPPDTSVYLHHMEHKLYEHKSSWLSSIKQPPPTNSTLIFLQETKTPKHNSKYIDNTFPNHKIIYNNINIVTICLICLRCSFVPYTPT